MPDALILTLPINLAIMYVQSHETQYDAIKDESNLFVRIWRRWANRYETGWAFLTYSCRNRSRRKNWSWSWQRPNIGRVLCQLINKRPCRWKSPTIVVWRTVPDIEPMADSRSHRCLSVECKFFFAFHSYSLFFIETGTRMNILGS